ncbi:hypothetical protein ACRAWD_11305 [Caulobacter segnis]
MNGVLIGCLYLPSGSPVPGPKFQYKLAWFRGPIDPRPEPPGRGRPLSILAGDYNVVPTEADIYPNHTPTAATPCCALKAAPAFQRLLGQGWTDALRAVHPEHPPWTYWSCLRERWPKDKGLRIDNPLLSPEVDGPT